ncbi:MAG: c-type cytochrome [Vicinamibacterales bacterium]
MVYHLRSLLLRPPAPSTTVRLSLGAGLVVALMVGVVAVAGLAAQAPSRTVWDGVYTEAQAARGATVYAAQCAGCHLQTLAGSEAAPALVGDQFNATWENGSIADLFERIRVSMPVDRPGSLSRRQTADIVAYMLRVGRFPSGAAPLDTQSELLQIRYLSSRP